MDLQKIIRISAVFLFAVLIIILALVFFFEKSENRESIIKNISGNISKNSFEQGGLSLVFDDGYETHYTLVYPLMKKYNLKGNVFILAEQTMFEGRELMSFSQAKELQDNGWEIGSHGLVHVCLNSINESDAENSIIQSKMILISRGLSINSFAYPYGCFYDKLKNITKNYYSSSKSLDWGYNDFSTLDKHKLYSKWVSKTNSPEEICSWIAYAKNNNKLLLLNFYYIDERKERNYDYLLEDFEKVLKCINNSRIEVKTINEAVK